MKKKSTLIYIILLLSSLLPVSAQTDKDKEQLPELPFFYSLYTGADLSGLGCHILDGDHISSEASLQLSIRNKFLPVMEIGWWKTNATDDETGIYYNAAAPYFRIGCDYNIMHAKPHLPGFLTVGLRLGHTSFKYDVASPPIKDPVWGYETDYSHKDIESNATWLELVVGVRARILKHIMMGWNLRHRSRLSVKDYDFSEPWYIPGMGKNKGSDFGFTYSIIYEIPFKKK